MPDPALPREIREAIRDNARLVADAALHLGRRSLDDPPSLPGMIADLEMIQGHVDVLGAFLHD